MEFFSVLMLSVFSMFIKNLERMHACMRSKFLINIENTESIKTEKNSTSYFHIISDYYSQKFPHYLYPYRSRTYRKVFHVASMDATWKTFR